MSTADRFAEFTEFATATEQPAPAPLLLPPGYISAIDPATGTIVAVPVQEAPTPAPAPELEPEPEQPLSAFEKAQIYARQQPEPVPAVAPPPAQGASPLVGQIVVLGGIASLAMLAAGGAIYIACEGLHVAGPSFHDATEFLKWAAAVLVVAVVVAVVAARKLKSAMTTTTSSDGTVVNALVHRHTEVNIGKQSGGFWKGQIHNNVR
ncbi:hypothetical protein [Streptacidiphilus anmyonensis]|uniref:hypothetical protein n=1 Tax=Streptacidiphilus anmyonensis TaxID=405782 RepID=UPI0005A78B02|nr:hypothetical protein [Streptacidiphilus anmyonensis]